MGNCGYGQEQGLGNCNLCSLVMLILIVLQFGKDKCEKKCSKGIDNSILFVIALFFLMSKC